MNIDILRARVEEIDNERRSIHQAAGDRDFNTDEQTRWDALETEESEARKAIADAEAEAERAKRVAESRAKWGTLQVGVKRDPFEGAADVRSESDLRARAITALSEVRFDDLRVSDGARQAAVERVESIEGAARHALAFGSPAYLSAFRSWLKSGGQPVYSQAEAEAVRASMSLTSANGGYMLPTLLDPTWIRTGAMTKNPLRQIARVVTGTQNVWHGVSVGNVTTAWKGEGSAFTDGSPTLGEITVTAAALTAYVTASYELFQDSDAQSQLPGLIGEAIDMAEGVAFVSGSGSTAPKGVITAVSGTAGSLVTVTTRGAFTSASAADTLALYNALPSRYEDSATWVANKQTFTTIQQQTIGTAGTLLTEMVAKNELLGSPIVRASSVTATTTSGNFIAVLGDFSQFIVYDRLGVSLEFIQNVVDGSGVPTGQRGLVAFKRVGSDVSDVNAFRLLKA